MQASFPIDPLRRVTYLDALRILAACCIVLLHVSAQNWHAVSVQSGTWLIFNCANAAGRWAVPVFLMISGVLFLDNARPLDTTRLWRRQIRRILSVFLFWSAVYALKSLLEGNSLSQAFSRFLEGHYHMWYLPTIAALYMVTPLMRRITESRQLTEYYLGITLIFVILIPRLLQWLAYVDVAPLSSFLPELDELISQFHFSFGQICLFYYVLGFYLAKYGIPHIRRPWLMAVSGYLCTMLLNAWYSRRTGTTGTAFFALNSLNVLCMSTGMFLFAKSLLPRLPTIAEQFIHRHTSYSLGVYLLHPLVLDLLEARGLHTLAFSPILSVPGITLLTLVISCILTALLHRTPFIKKFMV